MMGAFSSGLLNVLVLSLAVQEPQSLPPQGEAPAAGRREAAAVCSESRTLVARALRLHAERSYASASEQAEEVRLHAGCRFEFVQAMALIAHVEVAHRRDYVRGREAARWALGVDPRHPRLWYFLGSAEYRLGRYEEAAAALDQARRFSGSLQTPFARSETLQLLDETR